MKVRMREILFCFVLFCFRVQAEKRVCMLDGGGSTLHDTDECNYATLVHVGFNRAVSRCLLFGIDVIVTRSGRGGFNLLEGCEDRLIYF